MTPRPRGRSTRSVRRSRPLVSPTHPAAARRVGVAFLLAATAAAGPASAQTIRGTLLDAETRRAIPLGLVMMFTEAGDSVDATISGVDGRFVIASPTPGSFVLLAAALGYRETPAGVFELGRGGSLDVQYLLPAAPLPLDELVVTLERPTLDHHLVRNGFVRRLQRGLGAFVTPHEIEESTATSTEQLLENINGVRVRPVRITRGGTSVTRPDIGETVQIRGTRGWCTPTLYVDGIRLGYETDPSSLATTLTLSTVTPLGTVEAMEVYRRPAEVPVEYPTHPTADCGVLVVWTKVGLALGQRPTTSGVDPMGGTDRERLPTVSAYGPEPVTGERIRLDVRRAVATAAGISSPWSGTFLEVREAALVATDSASRRVVSVPLDGIETFHVWRERPAWHAYRRGAVAGAAAGLGVWGGLSLLCSWSECDGSGENRWLPGLASGLIVGALFGAQGPGHEWVNVSWEQAARGRDAAVAVHVRMRRP